MKLENIKELIEMMRANDLSELEIVDGQTRIMLKRGHDQAIQQVVAAPAVLPANGVAYSNVVSTADTGSAKPGSSEDSGLLEIVSPIVGTFYSAPSPNAGPFVEVGSKITEDTVVCVIEAMKVMNEVKSEIKGTVKKVLVTNGQAVEYGQRLFLVEPQ
jgi:acetyl-CoA carboxylase biotin carboxyl carrier protein